MITGTFKKHLDKQMKDPEFKKAWHDLGSEFELLDSIIKARERAGLTDDIAMGGSWTQGRVCTKAIFPSKILTQIFKIHI